ncbi:MAG TPA: hypothetical protein VHZ07_20225 [Bryobacteraceae bacterium]|jgi:hypothetical protein|nr:hypothetical protein [Bryobacteraceae bacterium]
MSYRRVEAGKLEKDQLLMTQKERDRLVALKKTKKNPIPRKQLQL